MPYDDCSTNGDGSRACSDCLSINLDDFKQLSWYKSLYSQPNSTILKTNEPPVDGQLPSLRANQLDAITELEKVDQKIQVIQSILSDAITHRARLQKVVDDFRSVLSPIRRVPSEIVHKILENIGTKDGASMRRKPDLNVTLHNGPWRFSTVCQSWRAVAVQSPEFWCDIRIDFTINNNREYRSSGLCDLLDEGIRRSASRGLQVSLDQGHLSRKADDDSDQAQNEDEDGARDVIKALFARSSQIQTLRIKMCSSSELNNIISSSCCSFTSLQRLFIGLRDCGPNEGSHILEAFYGSPSLVEVKLVCLLLTKPYRELRFPWNQLQIFEHAPSRSLADVVDVLCLCPRLQKYTVFYSSALTCNFTVTSTAVHHTAITHLELAKDSLPLLQHTTIPSLTTLRMREIDNSQLTPLTQFISRSQCSIQDLHVSLLRTSLKYDAFLEIFPSLTRLSLRLEKSTQLNYFQSALTPERLPRLEELKIEVFGEIYIGTLSTPQVMSTLIYIIQSRPRDLQSFTFFLSLWPLCKDPESVREMVDFLKALLVPYNQRLRAWIEGGMELHLFLGTFLRPNIHVNVVPVV
jgi:hypothetical protein